MSTASKGRCAHPACRCEVREGEAYCSEHCRERVESPLADQDDQCQCKHAACSSDKRDANAN
jgi:hypothetical protein